MPDAATSDGPARYPHSVATKETARPSSVASPSDRSASAEPGRYRVAGFWRRMVACVIDAVVLVPFVLVFAGATSAAAGGTFPRWGEIGVAYAVHLALDGGVPGWSALGTAVAITFLYFVIFTTTLGQTPGKRVVHARIIDAYGATPSIPRAIGRTLAQVISVALFSLGWLWIAFSREKRGLHDLLAGTYVVMVEHAATTSVRAEAVAS